MAVKTMEELMESVRTRLGDDQSDEALALLEDISDTYGDMQSRTSGGEDWKKKYDENDAEWRQKYRDRFFNKSNNNDDDDGDNGGGNSNKPLTFDELFKEG